MIDLYQIDSIFGSSIVVARVDMVLREDLGRPDGLADNDVYILDPCCGTGAYLVEVLRTIAATLKDKGEEALLGGKLKKAATERVFGFEILPARSWWRTCSSVCSCKARECRWKTKSTSGPVSI
jgi:hypothetical protein